MAKATDQHTPREWSLTDYHRYVCITSSCGINAALCEMERRIVSGQLLLIRREYDANDNLKGDAVGIDRFDFLSNYALQLFNYGVEVVTQRPAAELIPGGITYISRSRFSDSEMVRGGPGRVMDGYYTVVEQSSSSAPTAALPPSRKLITPPKKTKPTAPSKKPKETSETRLINVMNEIGLEKSGLLPREVYTQVRPQFIKKYPGRDVPAPSTFNRAYKRYINAKDTSE